MNQIELSVGVQVALDIAELNYFQGDLKDLSEENYARLKAQILKHGFAFSPHVWRHENRWFILDGHQRYRVLTMMRKEGFAVPKIPCTIVNAPDIKSAKELVLAGTAQFGEMTDQGLYEFISQNDLDPLEVFAENRFPEIDAEDFMEEFFKEPEAGGATDEDSVPENVPTRAKLGDIFTLGEHRVMCGDSTNQADVEYLMMNEKARMCFTDPPYNVAYEGNNWSSGKIKTGKPDWEGGIKNDEMSGAKFQEFLNKVYLQIDQVLEDGSPIYICGPCGRDGWNFVHAWEQTEWHFQATLVWLKSHLLISRWDYHPIYEPILYGWKKGVAHNFYGERNQSCVLEHKSAIRQNEAGFHPTQKPVSLIEQAINNSSKPGELLFEPFGGSGSTLIAAQKTKRLCHTMELDPKYVDTIIGRWQAYSGGEAVRADGIKWNDIGASQNP